MSLPFTFGTCPPQSSLRISLPPCGFGSDSEYAFIVLCIILAISALYELIEWAAAVSLGQGADEFLGTQGDVWDTQSDMFMALIGASTALLLLARWHDRQLAALRPH